MADPHRTHAGERDGNLQPANAAEPIGEPAEDYRTHDTSDTDRRDEDPDGQVGIAEIVREVQREIDLVHPAVTTGTADHEHERDEHHLAVLQHSPVTSEALDESRPSRSRAIRHAVVAEEEVDQAHDDAGDRDDEKDL